MPRTVIFSKIASVILDMEKLEDCLSEDFLSILKPSEITKRWIEIKEIQSHYMNKKFLFTFRFFSTIDFGYVWVFV